MTRENIGGIFFTEKETDFGKLFNEFNIYIRGLDADMKVKEDIVFQENTPEQSDQVIQALASYSSDSINDIKEHFRALNDAFDSVEFRVQNALNKLTT